MSENIDVLAKLRAVAERAGIEDHIYNDAAIKHIATFSPDRVLALLELIELYQSRFNRVGSGVLNKEINKQRKLLARIGDGV